MSDQSGGEVSVLKASKRRRPETWKKNMRKAKRNRGEEYVSQEVRKGRLWRHERLTQIYDAIYLCETPTITEEGGEEGSSDPPPVSEPRMVLQTNCVKRRWESKSLKSAQLS
ncbi:hypothetical protein E2C01_083822 [Portunus trituberculatus]|uniref:Uncharacterized protein n=1 Tax=Portunus trituberculatus TaxID=210409 RepID=A0A5B7J7K8_PORTR|nr:hypothetical protein [Portunus trituberculatus]